MRRRQPEIEALFQAGVRAFVLTSRGSHRAGASQRVRQSPQEDDADLRGIPGPIVASVSAAGGVTVLPITRMRRHGQR